MSPEFLPVKRKRKRDPRKTLNVRVQPRTKALLNQVARRRGQPVSVIVRKYIREGLNREGIAKERQLVLSQKFTNEKER